MKKVFLLAAIAVFVIAFFALDLGRFFTLETLKAQQAGLDAYYRAHPVQTALGYFAVYVTAAALSIPGATIITLAGGAVFGLGLGTVLVSFASSVGALLAFLTARYLLREGVQAKFGDSLRSINAGVERDGPFYLFAMRLVPAFPFFVVNLVLGLTTIRPWTFYWVSQLGMLAGTLVYVNAGTQLARIDSLRDILSTELLVSFLLLAVFPFIARRALAWVKARRALAGHPRPKHFDRNLIVIGAGSAGLVTAYIAAAVKAKVTLVEKHEMGGDCLNTGCVPSKALIRSAKLVSHMRRAHEFGLRSVRPEFDFAEVMERVQHVVRTVAPHDSVERYSALGVECLQGDAKIVSPYCVEIRNDEGVHRLTTRAIVIAAGARPFVPPIPGIDHVGCLTSDTIWKLRALPRRLVVLGGGPIGCELAQCYARFGADVTQIEMLPRILIREDPEVSALVCERMRAEGVRVLTGHKAKQFLVENGTKVLVCEHAGEDLRIEFDEVLCAVGRVANTQGYGLEELGIPVTKARTIEVNELLQTRFPNIYACGDVAGPYQFTHMAAHTAWYAAVNALFGRLRSFRVDYRVVPWCTFTEPEVARVGLNETEAKEKGIAHEVTVYDIADLDRAIADGEAHGFVKVLTVPGRDRILGVTIVGEHAGDLIAEYVSAMKHGIGLNKILATIHIYPTLAEANKLAAGAWKRAHAPERLLGWVERFHAWMRT